MFEVVAAFGFAEAFDELPAAFPQSCDGAFLGTADHPLELCEDLLDGIEIWTIRWQVPEFGPDCFDRGTHTGDFMRIEIVEDDDVARRQGRRQVLLDVATEQFAVDSTVDDQGRDEPPRSQAGQEGRCFPMAVRYRVEESRARRRAAAQAVSYSFSPTFRR